MTIQIIPISEQRKRIARWKHKKKGLIAFLVGQRRAYRAWGFEYVGHYTKSSAFNMARALDKKKRNMLLIETGEITATSRIPMYDVYRAYTLITMFHYTASCANCGRFIIIDNHRRYLVQRLGHRSFCSNKCVLANMMRAPWGRPYPLTIVQVTPTFDWGYLIGLVLGDGWLHASKLKGDYRVEASSTRRELPRIFNAACEAVKLRPRMSKPQKHVSHFPNGTMRHDVLYNCRVYSKNLYNFFRPCKLPDYRWVVPSIVFSNEECAKGFLTGIFDAEGSVIIQKGKHYHDRIDIYSKHKENLQQVKSLLILFDIESNFYKDGVIRWKLAILRSESKKKFAYIVRSKLTRKNQRLQQVLKHKILLRRHNPQVVARAFVLSQKGLNVKQISEQIGVPCSTIQKWISPTKGYHEWQGLPLTTLMNGGV